MHPIGHGTLYRSLAATENILLYWMGHKKIRGDLP